MESENGVLVEVEKIFVAEEENMDLKNEKKADETPNLSVAKTEFSEDVPKSKTSSQHKASVGGTKKNNKMAKDQASSTCSSALTHLKKRRMAKSFLVPSRGANADMTKKNIDDCTKKSDTQHLLKLHLLLKMMRMPVLLLLPTQLLPVLDFPSGWKNVLKTGRSSWQRWKKGYMPGKRKSVTCYQNIRYQQRAPYLLSLEELRTPHPRLIA